MGNCCNLDSLFCRNNHNLNGLWFTSSRCNPLDLNGLSLPHHAVMLLQHTDYFLIHNQLALSPRNAHVLGVSLRISTTDHLLCLLHVGCRQILEKTHIHPNAMSHTGRFWASIPPFLRLGKHISVLASVPTPCADAFRLVNQECARPIIYLMGRAFSCASSHSAQKMFTKTSRCFLYLRNNIDALNLRFLEHM